MAGDERELPTIFTDDISLSGEDDAIAELGADEESHRGAFGDFGGESGGLIERTFRERIVLVGVTTGGGDPLETDASLDELALLVDTAGADALERVHQRRDSPDPATYVGSGKAKEIKAVANAIDADTVVFDDELSPAQQFNSGEDPGRSALDRTAVILDIFAQNASSQEGKAQVELAQLLGTAFHGCGRAAEPSPSRGAGSEPVVPAKPSSRSTAAVSFGVCTSQPTFARSRLIVKPNPSNAPGPETGRSPWLPHQCGEVVAAQPARRLRGPCGGPALRHARCDDSSACAARW